MVAHWREIAAIAAVLALAVGAWLWWRRQKAMRWITKARTYIGVITRYATSGYDEHTSDCSDYVWRVLGKPKNHGGWWWNTDRIYDDAIGLRREFMRIAVNELQPGDLAVYPGHKDAKGKHHLGHVAFVSDPATHTIIDCSDTLNGVHEHVDTIAHFWTRPSAIFVRYKG